MASLMSLNSNQRLDIVSGKGGLPPLAVGYTLKKIPGREGGLAPASGLLHIEEDSRSGRWACPR